MLNAMNNLCRPMDSKVLSRLCYRSNDNKVQLSSTDRLIEMDELGLTKQGYSNSIARLKKVGLLTGERGVYMICLDAFLGCKVGNIKIEIHGINSKG